MAQGAPDEHPGQEAELTASDGATYDQFGNSVAICGSTIVAEACA
jgi:hypothetical protein